MRQVGQGLEGEGQPEQRPGGRGESESRQLGVSQAPWSQREGAEDRVGASGGPGDGLRTLHFILP